MLTHEDVLEFQKIHRKIYGTDIDYDQAVQEGLALLNFMRNFTE